MFVHIHTCMYWKIISYLFLLYQFYRIRYCFWYTLGLISADEPDRLEICLGVTEALIRKNPDGLAEVSHINVIITILQYVIELLRIALRL